MRERVTNLLLKKKARNSEKTLDLSLQQYIAISIFQCLLKKNIKMKPLVFMNRVGEDKELFDDDEDSSVIEKWAGDLWELARQKK